MTNTPAARVITLTTDFGYRDAFVGIMKGVIHAINPAVAIIDLTHGVTPQDVTGGALALAAAVDFFPSGAIHVAVVDPGVGSRRRPILVETDRACYIGPDNGLLSVAAGRQRLARVIHLSNPDYHLHPTSATFHGRDVFAPVAAHLSAGAPSEKLGQTVESFAVLKVPEPQRRHPGSIAGEVIYIDGFGNLTTNIRGEDLEALAPASVSVRIAGHVIRGLSANYASAGAGNYLVLFNSWGRLEISRCEGDARSGLGARVGTPVLLESA